jgi:protoheme IX farnesyltransferase
VPHFWLLILKYGDQYKKAGLPNLMDVFSIRQINNLSFIWIVASLVSGLMLASFGIIQNTIPNIVLIIITIIAISLFISLLNNENTDKRKRNFVLLNLYFMALMLILVTDRLIG